MLERRYRARFEHLQIAGFKLLQAHHLWGGLRSMVAAAFTLLALTGVYLTLDIALAQFPGTRGVAVSLLDLVVGPITLMGRGLVSSIPGLVFLLILVLVTRYVLRTLRMLFSAVEQGSVTLKGFDRDWAMPTYRIVRLLVVAFAVVVAFPYIPGSHSDAFKGVTLFLGLVFSLGSTSIVANTIAGYTMTYRRAFRVGDWIQVGDVVGEVTEVRVQVTHLRSRKNEEIVLPNSKILNSEVVNYSTLSTTKGLILHTTVGIGYDTPWRQVEAMLLTAAGRTPGLLLQPQPFVRALSLGDFAVTYELNVYCDRPGDKQAIYGDLHCNILDVFNGYGVAIMTPAYEGDPSVPSSCRRISGTPRRLVAPIRSVAEREPSARLGLALATGVAPEVERQAQQPETVNDPSQPEPGSAEMESARCRRWIAVETRRAAHRPSAAHRQRLAARSSASSAARTPRTTSPRKPARRTAEAWREPREGSHDPTSCRPASQDQGRPHRRTNVIERPCRRL
ncbi:MAG: mechanosensitive ion channel family protein [Betaproteobacteria bacterium]|nr:mechanosensitive ion channel family protein [Betaproteobacteria bacterium]